MHSETSISVDALAASPSGQGFSSKRACSSMVERRCHTAEVGGSIPTRAHQGASSLKDELPLRNRTDAGVPFNRCACALALISGGLDHHAVREMTALSPEAIQALIDAARGEGAMMDSGTRG